MLDVGRRGQVGGPDVLKRLQVARDDLQDEVYFAVEHVALADFRDRRDMRFERREVAFGLAAQADHREHGDRVAQGRGVELGVIALDRAGFLQRADAAQAGRGGQPDAIGQLDIGHPPVRLEQR